MDEFPRRGLVAFIACIANPVGQAIAAESGEPHQLDILRIVAMAQVPDQAAEGRRGHVVGKGFKRIVRVAHTNASFQLLLSCHIRVP